MVKRILFILLFFICFVGNAQKKSENFRSKKFLLQKDSIYIDSLSINSAKFKVFTNTLNVINSNEYQIDFGKALLVINSKKYQEIIVEYYRFPSFLTKVYSPFDERLIVPNGTNTGKLYSLTTNKKASEIKLFDGLQTSGSLSRGVRTGNNQNA